MGLFFCYNECVCVFSAGVRGVREFLQEGIIMEHFNHPRVMSLIGISFTEANYPTIITPFMPKGDLLSEP